MNLQSAVGREVEASRAMSVSLSSTVLQAAVWSYVSKLVFVSACGRFLVAGISLWALQFPKPFYKYSFFLFKILDRSPVTG